MKKYIWGDSKIDKDIEEYTIKSDVGLERGADYHLLPYAIEFEKAYLEFMFRMGRLNKEDYKRALKALDKILLEEVDLSGYEDMHSFIDEKVREVIGRSIYICRSRNDVITAIERLYLRDTLDTLTSELYRLYKSLEKKAIETEGVAAPAHTHYILADAIPLKTYFISYIEELYNIINLNPLAYNLIYTSPLGSGAIGGCPLKIDFTWLNRRLGFKYQHVTSVYGVNSRKTHNLIVMNLLSFIMGLMARISRDLIRLSTQYGVISLPREFTTGSSQLIHKINPDILEFIIGLHTQISSSLQILNQHYSEESGYQRFLQLDKSILIRNMKNVIVSIRIMSRLIERLTIRDIFKPPQDLKMTWIAHEIAWRYNIEYRRLYNEMKKMILRGHSIEDTLEKISRSHNIDLKELMKLMHTTFERKYNDSLLSDLEELTSRMEEIFSNLLKNV